MSGFLRRYRRRLTIAAACLMLFLAGLFLYNLSTRRAPLRRLEEITTRLTGPELAALPPAERRAHWHDWQRELKHLSPHWQREFWLRRDESFRSWLQDFMQTSREKQAAFLKEILSDINEFRRQWDGGSGGGPKWWDDLSPLEREMRQQEWLSMAGPEERAQVNSFLQMLAAQSQQLGRATTPSPWGDDAPT